MKKSPEFPEAIRTAQILFFINAVVWAALGVASLLRLDTADPTFIITAIVIAILMFGNAGAMVVSGIGLGKRQKFWFFLALAVLLINIILTFTDQFGLLDFITLALDLVLLGFLIATRTSFTHHDRE